MGRKRDTARDRSVFLLMGVSGSGKSTVGRLLADTLDSRFVDADDLHPVTNVRKMAGGAPLTDEDRWPWLDAVRREIAAALVAREGLVVACSALKRSYRRRLVLPGEPVRIVHLAGPPDLVAARMRARKDHFMPSGLLESQFRDLEEAPEALAIDIRLAPGEIVDRILSRARD